MNRGLKEFLDQHGVKYQLITHSPAYTAQEIAAIAHIPGKEMAKVVMVKADGVLVMTVLPASHIVDLKRTKEILGASHLELAHEDDYKDLLEGEPGATPPFGNLFNMKVIVSADLAEDTHIVFNAGNHRELVRMSYYDFERLVQPQISAFSVKEHSGKGGRSARQA